MNPALASPLPQSSTEAFVARHQAGVWRFLRALGCDAARAEEHCQDALLAALHHDVDRLPANEARRWLFTAAKNLFRMQLRAERRRPQAVSLDALDTAFHELHGARADGSDALTALRGCLESLPERQRALVAQRYQHERSRAELARELGLSEAGIKQALRRARLSLRDCVRRRTGTHLPTDEERR